MTDQSPPEQPPETRPRLGEIGLTNFAPYLMNRIMGRYNASLRDEMAGLGLTTPKMRALAVLSVIEGPLIRELAVYSVVEQSTLVAVAGPAGHRRPDPARGRCRRQPRHPHLHHRRRARGV